MLGIEFGLSVGKARALFLVLSPVGAVTVYSVYLKFSSELYYIDWLLLSRTISLANDAIWYYFTPRRVFS